MRRRTGPAILRAWTGTSAASASAMMAMRWKNWSRSLASAFLSSDLDLTPEVREDHASYIGNWLNVLKSDKRAIFTAASHAQRAADFLHGLQPQQAESQAA